LNLDSTSHRMQRSPCWALRSVVIMNSLRQSHLTGGGTSAFSRDRNRRRLNGWSRKRH